MFLNDLGVLCVLRERSERAVKKDLKGSHRKDAKNAKKTLFNRDEHDG